MDLFEKKICFWRDGQYEPIGSIDKHDAIVKKEFAERLLTQLKAMTTEISIGDFYGDDFLRLSDIENEIEQLMK